MFTRIPRRRGFTLVELLVVIGIIALLLSILMPAMNAVREAGKRTTCLSNIRQLTFAWQSYSDDNKGALVLATPADHRQIPWFLAGGNWPVGPNGTTMSIPGNSEQSIKYGSLFKYVGSQKVYRCASDQAFHRVSYGINSYLNGEGNLADEAAVITNRNRIRNADRTFVFMDENDWRGGPNDSYNMGSFMVARYPSSTWIDYPVSWHSGGTCISFADSHAEHWRWVDTRTRGLRTNNVSTPNNADLVRLQRVRGELR